MVCPATKVVVPLVLEMLSDVAGETVLVTVLMLLLGFGSVMAPVMVATAMLVAVPVNVLLSVAVTR